jgi:hypothetical protein
MKKIREHLGILIGKTHIPVWLAILLGVVVVFRIPSLFEPFYYGDETIYLTLGEGIKKGLVLYSQIHDNKPPLLYLTAMIAGNVFWFKAILMLWSMLTITMFWHLCKVLFSNKEKVIKIATILFGILTTIPLFEGNIANSEIFMIGPTIVAIFLLLRKEPDIKTVFFAGTLFSISALFKIPAAFDVPAIMIYWLITNGLNKKGFIKTIKNSAILTLGFLVPIGITFVYFYFKGAFKEYLIAAYLQNFGYLSSWREGSQQSSLSKNLPLLIRGSIVALGSLVLYLKRKSLSKEFILICLWLLFGLFAVTLSERPYPHYLIQIVPELSLLLGILVADRTIKQALVVIPLLLTFSVPVIYKFWYYPTTSYYVKFVKFALGLSSKQEYMATFSKNVNINYQIAEFIGNSTGPDEKVFVWGQESPNIYALSRRLPPSKYVADYHFFDYADMGKEADSIIKAKPSFIVVLPKSRPYPELISQLRKNYYQINEIEGVEIWRLKGIKTK